jgi:hypothetical protein
MREPFPNQSLSAKDLTQQRSSTQFTLGYIEHVYLCKLWYVCWIQDLNLFHGDYSPISQTTLAYLCSTGFND